VVGATSKDLFPLWNGIDSYEPLARAVQRIGEFGYSPQQ
jgi:hypothetical protein